MPSDVENAWAAGLMDGDGCVGLTTDSRSRFRKPVVVVDSTDIELLDELQRLYGGSLVVKRKTRDHHRQAYSWRIYGARQIIAFLAMILPYMRCPPKVTRARMLVEEWESVTPRNGYYTDDMAATKLAYEDRFFAAGSGRGASLRKRR